MYIHIVDHPPSCVQLVERENVRATLSYNEWYEIQFFTNSKKVSL